MPLPVLVTGATGFLGPYLVERLIAHGALHIRCLVRASSDCSKLERIQQEHPNSRIEFIPGNMLSREDLARAVAGVSHIYHLAAALRGSPADMTLNTVVGSQRLLEAIGSLPIRVVLVSSFAVYGAAALPSNATIDEDTPLETHPEKRDVYAQTKLRQETLFREYQQREHFELVVLRPGVIYGPGGGAFSVRVGLQLPDSSFISAGATRSRSRTWKTVPKRSWWQECTPIPRATPLTCTTTTCLPPVNTSVSTGRR